MIALGVPDDRMSFEDRSRDTWENAVFTKELVQPKPGERWLLVTSATHMPRSVGIFRKIGFDVIPYPVDYQTGGVAGDFVGFRRPGEAFPRAGDRLARMDRARVLLADRQEFGAASGAVSLQSLRGSKPRRITPFTSSGSAGLPLR